MGNDISEGSVSVLMELTILLTYIVATLGHMHYILWLTDPDKRLSGLSERKK